MVRRRIRSFRQDERGAIAATYALALFGLMAIAVVGFDYGRLMAMDTELQSAADQAALAAATQLNGQTDAMNLAQQAATTAFATAASAYVNETRFSNRDDDGDGDPRPITQLTFAFYSGYDYDADAPTGALDPETDDGELAKVVEVTVEGREVFYALTPVVGAISSGDIAAKAMATLEQATCNVTPMMFCAPTPSFGQEADKGKSIRLHLMSEAQADSGNTIPLAPGNFGFLDIPYDTKGNPNRRMGLNGTAQVCVGGGVDSEPGKRNSEVPAFNTRFDVYPQGGNISCNDGTGDFCPAVNVRTDYVQVKSFSSGGGYTLAEVTGKTTAQMSSLVGGCGSANNDPWEVIQSLPSATNAANPKVVPTLIGFSPDTCITNGSCSVVGDGSWDGVAYMNANHPGVALSTAAPNGTRFEVYQWELEAGTRDTRLQQGRAVGYETERRNNSANSKYNVKLYCSYPRPVNEPPGIEAGDDQKDRRLLTVAAVDCTGLNGRDAVKVLRWVDLFLINPANKNGSDNEFHAEIVGPGTPAGGGLGFQNFGRGKAVLIR